MVQQLFFFCHETTLGAVSTLFSHYKGTEIFRYYQIFLNYLMFFKFLCCIC